MHIEVVVTIIPDIKVQFNTSAVTEEVVNDTSNDVYNREFKAWADSISADWK
jgi:hypothetical protein